MIKYNAVYVTGHSKDQLEASIRRYAAQGYECSGSPSVTDLSNGRKEYSQEMRASAIVGNPLGEDKPYDESA